MLRNTWPLSFMKRPAAIPGHLYWRLRFPHGNVGAVSDFLIIREIEMRATVGGADQCTGGTAFASSDLGGGSWVPANAFDNSSAEWSTTSGQDVNSHIGYQFASPVVVEEFTVQVSTDANLVPRSLVLEYSDNGTNYTPVAEATLLSWTSTEIKTFAVASYPLNLFNYVMFLAGFEGADASTSLGNSQGKVANAMTAVGNAQIDTAQFKFGSSSILLDGSGDYVSLADNYYWSPLLSGCAAEAWVRFHPSANLTLGHVIMAQYNTAGSNRSWTFQYNNGNLVFSSSVDGITNVTQVFGAWAPSVSTWYHVVGARSAIDPGTYRLFIGGAMLAKATGGASGNFFPANAILTVGARGTPSDYFHGWIDEPRFINGYCPPEYDSDAGFTPPVAAFPRS